MAISQRALDHSAAAYMLFTDVGKTTSSKIYQQIGYRYVANLNEYRIALARRGR